MNNRLNRFQLTLDQKLERLNEALERMSVRERYMVVFTTVFVVVVGVGWALWSMHRLADEQQKRLTDLKDQMVWMQSNAVTMKPQGEGQLSVAEKVQRISQQQGLSVSSQQVGEQLQIVADHQSYAVLANFLMQLSQMGLSVEKMELVSANNQIKLTATVH
ncbi:type II secretion system protein GspM [Acinetobacter baylyi]|uniref:type II secretion system protein GspM n=1 Tax=Acinetobacter baylyi TaxID=202950 RepID=UPI000EA08DC4|nr:type II secretion system protein GspM [Acinetobacter baylyi]